MTRRLRRLLFYACLLVMGSFVIESDIITGHKLHRLSNSVTWYERPKETEEAE